MKFNILDYSQRIAISMGLDLPDLHILGWIQDFWPEMKKKIIDGEEYGWIQYGYFIKDMPIVKIGTADGLYRRLKNLEKIGLLKHKGVKDSEGSFSYYKITSRIVELLKDKPLNGGTDEKQDGGTDQKSDGTDKKPDPVRTKSRTKDNPSIKSFLSLSDEEKKEKLKNLFKEKEYKSDYEKYFLFRQKQSWKSLTDLGADIAWWENGFKEKNPDKYIKTATGNKSLQVEESPEIIKIRSDIKFFVGNDAQLFDFYSLEKGSEGWKIKANKAALKYQEVLSKINVKIEVK